MTRFNPNTLQPDDDYELAADAYEDSDRFLTDALEHFAEQDPEDLPVQLVARVAAWYVDTDQYDMVVDDVAAGEVTL